jgi:hypothetical protein
MFRIMQDPSSGSIDSCLIKTTRKTTSTVEPLRVVLIKYESVLPDDGSHVIRNMLSNFNVWFILEFYITQILISTTSRFQRISWLIKVTDNNDARWKL